MKGESKLTAEQFADFMGVSMTELSKRNASIIKKAEKLGYLIVKEGSGKKATYRVEPKAAIQDEITKTLFSEKNQQIDFNRAWIKYDKYVFDVLLMLALKPTDTFFEGTYKDIISYLELPDSDYTMKCLKNAIKELVDKDIIVAYFDPKQKYKQVLVLFIRPSAKEELFPIQIEGIQAAKVICEQYGVKWENFLKVWLALKLFKIDGQNIFTNKDLTEITGIKSSTTITKILNAFTESGILFRHKKEVSTAADYGFIRCLGKSVLYNFDFSAL